MAETASAPMKGASPTVLPQEKPEGMVSTRAREILECMRLQRESFLASIKPTEAEAAARKLVEKPDPPAAKALEGGKPPLFTVSEAESITQRLNESINRRKERLARFSTSAEYKYRSARMSSSDYNFRKITQSPHSHTTASSTAENSSFFSTPTDGSSSHGYDSDGPFPQIEVPLPRYPNLEEIEETLNETGSERDGGESYTNKQSIANDTLCSKEAEETELEITVHSDMSDSEAETETSKPLGAPMMTLFGHASFDESVTRPPKLVHCTSFSPVQDKKGRHSPGGAPTGRVSSNSIVSGLSQFSSGAMGPLGPTVEQRKKALLKTLSNTVAELEKMNVDAEEISSVVSSVDGERRFRNRSRADSSSFTSIGISSASSFSCDTADENSETSGWISPDLRSKASTLLPHGRVHDDDTLATDQSCSESTIQEISFHSASSSIDYNFENPLGDLLPTDSEAESKLLFTPPKGEERKRPERVPREPPSSKGLTSSKVTFSVENTMVRLRTPSPEELHAMSFPRGNLWNIAKSSGLSFEEENEDDSPIRIHGRPVYRSFDYVAYAAEYKCGARGGLLDLAMASGMPKSTQITPLRKPKTPRVNGRRRWKLKARGGSYHLAVWTNLTNNVQSPSSIFRSRPVSEEKAPVLPTQPSTSPNMAQINARIRSSKIKWGGKGSFHYLSNETRKSL